MQKFSFDRNRCLNCEIELYEGAPSLFCSNCEPVFPKKPTALAPMQPDAHIGAEQTARSWSRKVIADLGEYEGGYIKPSAIFRDDLNYRVPADCEVKEEPDGKFSLRVFRYKDLILVDMHSIGDRWFKDLKRPAGNIVSFEVQIVDLDL